MLKILNLVFHSVALSSGLYYSHWVLTNMNPTVFSGHAAYLTQWSQKLENVLLLCLLLDDIRALSGSRASGTATEQNLSSISLVSSFSRSDDILDNNSHFLGKWNKFLDGFFSIIFTLTTMVGILVRTRLLHGCPFASDRQRSVNCTGKPFSNNNLYRCIHHLARASNRPFLRPATLLLTVLVDLLLQ